MVDQQWRDLEFLRVYKYLPILMSLHGTKIGTTPRSSMSSLYFQDYFYKNDSVP